MPVRKAEAIWEGSISEGKGTMKAGSGAFQGNYTHASRFEEESGTNPEEMIAAAHAGCYSMALSSNLNKAGFTSKRIVTQAQVTLERVEGKARITKIRLDSQAEVPGVDEQKFQEIAEAARKGCPVSVALSGVEITLNARLVS